MSGARACLAAMFWMAACVNSSVSAAGSVVRPLSGDAYVIQDDAGCWGDAARGITHQRGPGYQARKTLDTSGVPEEFWRQVTEVRLSAFFCVRDYSWHDLAKPNGLDETLQIVVNGRAIDVPTRDGLPRYAEGKSMGLAMRWHDLRLPKDAVVRGLNEIVFRMAAPEGKKPDDYLYLGIDNSVPGGRSAARFSDKSDWRPDKLNALGAQGEYMVRLHLIRGRRELRAAWRPAQSRLDDPAGLLLYAGSHGPAARVEWDARKLDWLSPVGVEIEVADGRAFTFQWLDEHGQPVSPPVKARGPRFETRLEGPAAARRGGLQMAKDLPVRAVAVRAATSYYPLPRLPNMVPPICAPRGAEADRPPTCRVDGENVTLQNANLRCRFSTAEGRLRLVSLYNEPAAAEMLRQRTDCPLWLVEVDGKRYAGSRDFVCREVRARRDGHGFSAVLLCEPVGLEAALEVRIDDELRLGLSLANRGAKDVDFKTAFPVLASLAISDDPGDDYYFFPAGCIVSDSPVVIRRGYGDHEALYQLIDLFSPSRGAGMAVRSTDDDGRHKVLTLRKHVPGQAPLMQDNWRTRTAEEFLWTNSLAGGSFEAVAGTSVAFEYLRRTRRPGEWFAPKEAALRAHAGDWHVPMRAYAEWCHRAWKFRPLPSRLTPVVNMAAAGWGQGFLFRDGKYRTDIIRPRCDCIELMSWWDWSPLGPWSTPFERIRDVLTEAELKRWSSYFVKDPVTGQTMWNNQPGDYDGYNERFGGLAAFRKAIETYRRMGPLVTLYTDPIRCDDNTKLGRSHGREWGVVQPDGQYVKSYHVWNMCHDVAEYRQWVAQAMQRVLRETGADGIRLDEYGHRGWACFNKLHKHTFAEWGTTEWQRAIAETTRLIRRAMDEVNPTSVLTTEHPGYDHLLPFIEGCITYDLTVLASPLRPLECNLQRFYFPECKAYEMDHRGADRRHRKRFWNAVGSFGAMYPENLDIALRENADAFDGRDCEPLVPTLVERLYANRFAAGQKTIYTLYNATGHTRAAPVLRLPRRAGWHAVELLGATEVECRPEGEELVASVYVPSEDVACLAWLPKRLEAEQGPERIEVRLDAACPGCQVSVGDANGKALVTRETGGRGQALSIELKDLAAGTSPACVKLLKNGRLLDLAPLVRSAR